MLNLHEYALCCVRKQSGANIRTKILFYSLNYLLTIKTKVLKEGAPT